MLGSAQDNSSQPLEIYDSEDEQPPQFEGGENEEELEENEEEESEEETKQSGQEKWEEAKQPSEIPLQNPM